MADISLDQVMDDERYNLISLYESTNPENEKRHILTFWWHIF